MTLIQRFIWHTVTRAALAGVFVLNSAAAAPKTQIPQTTNPESAFQAAMHYTVKIRSLVETPFADDEKGAFEGAGFLVDRDKRWIMTNAHVVARSPSRVTAAFKGGRFIPLRKVYIDPFLDLAILQISTNQLPNNVTIASLECDKSPGVGHLVGAFGHPWSLSYTGTRGIVSGTTVQSGIEWLQTDASLNSGNSGGPLISLITGQVVGINTAILEGDNSENLNFAVPIKYACRVLTLLREGKDPSPPDLPVLFFDYDDETKSLKVAAAYFDNSEASGVLKENDVIEEVADTPGTIQNETQFIDALRGHLDQVRLKILRDGQPVTLTGRFKPMPRVTERQGLYLSGIVIAPSNFRDTPEANLGKSLIVHYVDEGSLANAQGFQVWDFIKSVDGKSFHELGALATYLKTANNPVRFVIKRFSEAHDRIYEYHEFELPTEMLTMIKN